MTGPTTASASAVPASRDTSLDVQERMDAYYRTMTPGQKVALVASLTASVDAMARARLRREDPSADAEAVEERLRALLWPTALHRAFFAARRRWLAEQS